MSSIVPGYEYDIFISYRQKDNKGDRWVSEFVDALKTELESTFKEEISVYFDINPHDGLLETHDVNASLKEKLKCLVFIPIISRTYCDPKSFAWEYEFKAFVEQASQDQFGLKVKLSNGNVANRILPIQIHDLTAEDKTLLEKELGGVLRSIEFIYKEPGVDKPLAPEDNEKKNLNNTKYRIQIIKVAHAIKDIVLGLKTEHDPLVKGTPPLKELLNEEKKEDSRKGVINKRIIHQQSKRLLIILFSVFLCISGAFAVFKIRGGSKKANSIAKLEKSIAVLPFVNNSPEKENEYFCTAMVEQIVTQLQKIRSLRVKARTSIEKYRNPDRDLKSIGRELGVSLIIEGNIWKAGDDIRITTQLIDTKTGDNLWAETYDGKYTKAIFEFQSNVAKKVAASLNAVITPQEAKRIDSKPTTEMLAYDLCAKGHEMVRKWRYTNDSLNLRLAINLYNQALEIDPEYIDALGGKGMTYNEAGKYDSALFYYQKIEEINPNNLVSAAGKSGIYLYSNRPDSAFKYAQIALDHAPNDPWANLLMGQLFFWYKNDVINGLPYYQKAYDLGGDSWAEINGSIVYVYLYIGDYKKALKYSKKALSLRSECDLINQYDYMFLAQGKYDEALHILDSICSVTACEQNCDFMKFQIYTTQKEFEKAEKNYNKAVEAGYKRSADDDIYIACLYKETGRKKEAYSILNNSIKRDENLLKDNGAILWFNNITLRLAAAYAILDENKKALKYLSEIEKSGLIELPCTIRTFPGFDKLRGDPEFKSILKRIEDKKDILRTQVKEMEQRGELNM
jgi:TolB-like protein/Tfp pilus assembly protein PilF